MRQRCIYVYNESTGGIAVVCLSAMCIPVANISVRYNTSFPVVVLIAGRLLKLFESACAFKLVVYFIAWKPAFCSRALLSHVVLSPTTALRFCFFPVSMWKILQTLMRSFRHFQAKIHSNLFHPAILKLVKGLCNLSKRFLERCVHS